MSSFQCDLIKPPNAGKVWMSDSIPNKTIDVITDVIILVNLSVKETPGDWFLGVGSANERRRCYNVTSSLIGWAHTQINTVK